MHPPSADSIKAYTRLGLHVYDPLIVNLVAPRVWDCSPDVLVEHYRAHVTSNHADIGVGTGFFLDRCGFDSPSPNSRSASSRSVRLALIDLQANCLAHAARRLARYRPQTYVRDALRPIEGIPGGPFDSIALGGILHCLSGDLRNKCRVLDSIGALARAGTKLFGYTLVCDEVPRHARRRVVHRVLNQLRVVDNSNDRLADLHTELRARFIDCRVEAVGCMALFSARVSS
jgi:hypothetical protein